MRTALCALWCLLAGCEATPAVKQPYFAAEATRFAPGIVSTQFSDIRLTISPDGRTALWFSRNRPGGAGGYDIWISRRDGHGDADGAGERASWSAAEPVPFNTAGRDFDPAFSADGRHVYFASDRPGGAGGDDLYRVPYIGREFGAVEPLGAAVNSAGNEWAPMLSPDGRTLLFSSDGHGGAGRMDLLFADVSGNDFTRARAVPGDLNTGADEFDAAFLDDGATLVFTRAPDLRKDDVQLFHARPTRARYDRGTALPASVNTAGGHAYAPMLDWSRPRRITFSDGRDVHVIEYRWK